MTKKIATFCFAVLVLTSSAFAFNQSHLDKVKNYEDCEKCDLTGANLHFVKMNHLDLRGTNFSGASFLYTENLFFFLIIILRKVASPKSSMTRTGF